MFRSISILISGAVWMAASPAAAGLIASTSFENEASLVPYTNAAATGSLPDGTVVDLLNSGGTVTDPSTVDSTASSIAAGDLGFDATWVSLGSGTGLSDGDPVGVSEFPGAASSFTDGVQGYQIADPDGLYRLTFDAVDVSAFTDVVASVDYFLQGTTWEDEDVLYIFATTDRGTFTLIDTAGSDINDLNIEGRFNTATAIIPDAATVVQLVAEFTSNSGTENLYLDNVRFDGNAAPAAVPEPMTVVLLGVAGCGGLLMRRRGGRNGGSARVENAGSR